MLVPHTLTVLMTNRCTAECAHCCMNSGPARTGALDFPSIRKTIDELHEAGPLLTVVFAGGEPTLVKGPLRKAITYCSNQGISTRLVTNAAWARNPDMAERFLNTLHACGLDELNISADDYHLPFIPFENVVNAWKAAKGLGLSSVVIANGSGPKSTVTPDYIIEQLGEEVALRFNADGSENEDPLIEPHGTLYMLSNSKLQRLERGARDLQESEFDLWDDHSSLNVPCPFAIRNAALSPQGHLLACCGFELDGNEVLDFGDVRQSYVPDIVETANNNMIVNSIAYFGPLYLMRFVQSVAPDVAFPKKFGSICEVCRAVVTSPKAVQVLNQHVADLGPAVIQRRMDVAAGSEGLS